MKQIVSKKHFGMYIMAIDADGALQIQAPTLLKPITIESQQVQELAQWLAEQFALPAQATTAPAGTSAASVSPLVSPEVEVPQPEPEESPEESAQRILQQIIAVTQEQYPASLAPENRDRFIEQISRNPEIKPLISQGKISRKQVMLWVEKILGTRW